MRLQCWLGQGEAFIPCGETAVLGAEAPRAPISSSPVSLGQEHALLQGSVRSLNSPDPRRKESFGRGKKLTEPRGLRGVRRLPRRCGDRREICGESQPRGAGALSLQRGAVPAGVPGPAFGDRPNRRVR